MHAAADRSVPGLAQRLVGRLATEGRRDADLLASFRADRDEAAFAALVARHGPVVWGVCRRGLADPGDAEDAFQATFLALVRRLDRAERLESLGGWLHAVARQVTHNVRRARQRREAHERAAAAGRAAAEAGVPVSDLGAVLDEVLAGLPAKYREPLVRCYLQGKTHAEAARELGCPPTTLADRLARGGELLRGRLARRGVTLSVGHVTALLVAGGGAGLAAVPAGLARVTTAAAVTFFPGGIAATAAGRLAAEVVGTTSGVRRGLYGLLFAASVGAATAVGVGLPGSGPDATPPSPPPAGRPGDAVGGGATDRFGDRLPAGAELRLGTLRFRTGRIDGDSGVAFGPGGVLISAHGGDAAFVWDPATGRELKRLTVPAACCGVSATADGRTLAAAGAREVWACDLTADPPRVLWTAATDAGNRSAAEFSPDGRLVATAGAKGTSVLLLDAATGRAVRTLAGPGNRFAFSPDSGRLAAWVRGERPAVRVWDVAAGTELFTVASGDGKRSVGGVAFSPDGATLATVGEDCRLRLWDAATGAERRTLADDADPAAFVGFAADGTLVEAGGGRARRWDVATGRAARPTTAAPAGGWSWAYRLSADGSRLAVTHPAGAAVWDCATGREVGGAVGVPDGPVYAVAFAADGASLATASYDPAVGSAVHVWDPATGRLRRRLDPGPRQLVWDVSLGAEGAAACVGAVGGTFADLPPPSRLARWDAATGAARPDLPLPGDQRCAAFSPDGRLVAVGTRGGVGVFDREFGREVKSFPRLPSALAFSADGSRLAAVVAAGRVLVWPLAGGAALEWAPPPAAPGQPAPLGATVALSPDGRLVAVAASDRGGTIRVGEVATGAELLRLDCRQVGLPTRSIAFSPDGRLLAAGDTAGEVRVWEVVSGSERHRFAGHRGEVLAVAFSPDGRRLASGSVDSTALLWNLTHAPAPADRPKPGELWAALGSADGPAAHRAVAALARDPAAAVPMLRDRLTPQEATADRVRRLVAELGDERFPVREAASRELAGKGFQAEAELRRAATDAPSAEARARARRLLDRLGRHAPAGWAVARAVEALERMGADPAAGALLEELARTAPDSLAGQEARAARRRLGAAAPAKP